MTVVFFAFPGHKETLTLVSVCLTITTNLTPLDISLAYFYSFFFTLCTSNYFLIFTNSRFFKLDPHSVLFFCFVISCKLKNVDFFIAGSIFSTITTDKLIVLSGFTATTTEVENTHSSVYCSLKT